MILSDEFWDQLPWYFLVLAGVIAVAWWWQRKVTNLQRGLFSAGILISLGLSLQCHDFGSSIVVVRFPASGSPIVRDRGHFLFSKNYVFQNGSKTRLVPAADGLSTLIVNDSPKTLRIQYVHYASFHDDAPMVAGDTIAPMSTKVHDTPIGEIGPDEIPPETMESPMGIGARAWLTWDDDAK